jgi:hypothetical protein
MARAPISDPGDENLKVGRPETVAGGVAAASTSLSHVRADTGLIRGARALLKLNQTDGFDCPGCAWPEADLRSHLEFCENGVKAIVEETTRRRVDDVAERRSLRSVRLWQSAWGSSFTGSRDRLLARGGEGEELLAAGGVVAEQPVDG